MEKKTIGKFLAALRKAHGYTQQQVAEILCVSNKTISKWECDDGYPEISMLSAIAELYDVTVDEILRGERITQTPPKSDAHKTEERTKLLLEKSMLKFKNYSAVSIPLGLGAVILSVVTLNNELLITWVGRFFILIMIIVSLVFAIIGRNNYRSSLNSSSIDKCALKDAYNQLDKLGCVTFFSVSSTLLINMLNIIYPIMMQGYAWAIIFIIFCGLISLIVYGVKKSVKREKTKQSAEVLKLRKKIVKITAISIAAIIAFTTATTVLIAYADTHWVTFSHCFTDYPNETKTPERDYMNLKNHIVNGEELYYSYILYETNSGKYAFAGYKFEDKPVLTEDGYNFESFVNNTSTETLYFNTKKEREDFIENHTAFFYTTWIYTVKDINFIDEKYAFTYKKSTESWLSDAYNALSYLQAMNIVAGIACSLSVPTALVVYLVKKRKIEHTSVL